MQPNDPRGVNSGGSRPSNQPAGSEPDAQETRIWMDHERVAALHDGKLGAPERDELLAGIAADDDQSWLFAETAAVLAELEAAHAADADPRDGTDADDPPAFVADPPPAPTVEPVAAADGVIPIATRRPAETPPAPTADDEAAAHEDDGVIPIASRRRSPRRWMAYGAIAAVLVGIGVTAALLNRAENARLDDPVSAVAMLERGTAPGLAEGWDETWDPAKRSGNVHRKAPEPLAVQVGAYLVDLELAAAAGDTATVRNVSAAMSDLLITQTRGGDAAEPYEAIRKDDRNVPARLAEGRDRVRNWVDTDWLELGIWAETARNAAARRDAAFFRQPATRRVLDRAAALHDDHDKVPTALAAVRAALPRDDGRANWKDLEDRLRDLLTAAGD